MTYRKHYLASVFNGAVGSHLPEINIVRRWQVKLFKNDPNSSVQPGQDERPRWMPDACGC